MHDDTQNTHCLTGPELAQIYGVSAMTITRWVRRGCPTVRTQPYLFDLDEVRAWQAQRRRCPGPGRPPKTNPNP